MCSYDQEAKSSVQQCTQQEEGSIFSSTLCLPLFLVITVYSTSSGARSFRHNREFIDRIRGSAKLFLPMRRKEIDPQSVRSPRKMRTRDKGQMKTAPFHHRAERCKSDLGLYRQQQHRLVDSCFLCVFVVSMDTDRSVIDVECKRCFEVDVQLI